MNRSAALLAVVCLLSCLGTLNAQGQDKALPANPTQWLNSGPVNVEGLTGKGIVLYFFEESCPRCEGRWPELLKVAKEYEGKPVMFIAVNSGTDPRTIASYARNNGISWPVLLDTDRSLEKKFGVPEVSLQNIWQTVVITPEGQVRKAGIDFNGAAQMASTGAKWKVDPAAVPADLRSAWLAIELGEYAKAGPALRKAANSAKPETKEAAEKLQAAVNEEIAAQVSEAQAKATAGQPWQAWQIYDQITQKYVGFDLPEEAAAAQQALQQDPVVINEKKAANTLALARKTASSGSPAAVRRGKAILERLLTESPDTQAAAEARQILSSLP